MKLELIFEEFPDGSISGGMGLKNNAVMVHAFRIKSLHIRDLVHPDRS